MRALSLTGVAAALAVGVIAGCGGAAPAPPPATAAQAAVVLAPPGGVLAPGTGERLIVNVGSESVGSDADGRVVTRILVVGRDGSNHRLQLVPGSWGLPAAVPGQPEGIAWDGSRVVLVSTDDPGRFVAVSVRGSRAPLVVAPRGRFVYDGISVDGKQLFVTQLADAHGAAAYRIMRVDLASGRLDAQPIVDKLDGGEAMAGTPIARAAASDFLYTVYARGARPFVHALEGAGNFSLCLDLPPEPRATARRAWAARALSPTAVLISNRVLRRAYRLQGGELTPIAYRARLE
jgi:hypothetical protein